MSGKIVVKGYQVGSKIDQLGLRTLYRAIHLQSGKEVFLQLSLRELGGRWTLL